MLFYSDDVMFVVMTTFEFSMQTNQKMPQTKEKKERLKDECGHRIDSFNQSLVFKIPKNKFPILQFDAFLFSLISILNMFRTVWYFTTKLIWMIRKKSECK